MRAYIYIRIPVCLKGKPVTAVSRDSTHVMCEKMQRSSHDEAMNRNRLGVSVYQLLTIGHSQGELALVSRYPLNPETSLRDLVTRRLDPRIATRSNAS